MKTDQVIAFCGPQGCWSATPLAGNRVKQNNLRTEATNNFYLGHCSFEQKKSFNLILQRFWSGLDTIDPK